MQINIKNIETEKTPEDEIMPTKNQASELRQDIVTGDWVVIATGRAKRPDAFADFQRTKDDKGIEDCLFEDPVASGQEPDVLIYTDKDGQWSLRVFPNKFPTVSQSEIMKPQPEGPYFSMPGVGFHEVVVTRDHFKQLALMDVLQVAEVFDAYQDRYLDLMNKKNVNFIAIFHNHGREVGASIAHPHSQIMAIPMIAPYPKLELDGAELYYRSNKQCVYCVMTEYESQFKERVVFENDEFIAFCPFASRVAFEVWVVPKKHNPYFERITDDQKIKLAQVFSKSLGAIYKALNDPPYNFYINTSPCDGKDYPHFHWHIEILPHTSIWAGFELETGVEISTIQPEAAAEYLRKKL
ncbi:MAG: galactose-1-phosphate uridylyltransferase [Candidatus Moranbacteria bacterium]|nr:galactose-1-phosphate uridylyltransferase [Candidatus Moranbacteria bacterium]